jgi:hypothetical protein
MGEKFAPDRLKTRNLLRLPASPRQQVAIRPGTSLA